MEEKKKKRKPRKQKKEVKEPIKKKKKWLFLGLGGVLFLALLGGCIFFFGIRKDITKEFQKKVSIEAGLSLEEIEKAIKRDFSLSKNTKITYQNVKDKKKLLTKTVYYDKKGKEVEKEEAVITQNGKEVLKKGYLKKEEVVGVGTYQVTLEDKKNHKTYTTTLTIQDREPPVLTLKDVEVEEGQEIIISAFVKSCLDNSHEACQYEYVDEKGKKLASIDGSVGERKVRIVAFDGSKNRSQVKTANLKVNPKKEEPENNESGTVSGKGSTTSTSGYARSNPIVDTALSLVGNTNMVCTEVAERALNAVGKTLWISSYGTVYNTLTGEVLGRGKEACDAVSGEQRIPFGNTMSGTDEHGNQVSSEGFLLVRNRKAYRYVRRDCTNGVCTETDASSSMLGLDVFSCQEDRYYTEGNIRSIGTRISLNAIQPGDFLFYQNGGRGTTHIAVYIGNGNAVHGGFNGRNVVIYSMYIDGASTPEAYRVFY